MWEAIVWGTCLRIAQASLQAAPFIFTGLCIMGLLHRLMGQQHTRWLFGSNSVASLLQAWVIGLLLPGCSLGAIPIVKQLRRSGIAAGTILAFALSSPLFDPLSILYGLTLSKPFTIVAFALCSLVVVTISGSLFDRMFPAIEPELSEPPATPHGIKRLLAILVVMARESVSGTAGLIAIGLAGVGLLSVLLPPGSLQRTMAHDNPWSPLVMTAIAIPAYATPMTAMGQLGSMFQHGNSIGAAFILLVFGAGLNLGLLTWIVLNYGIKKSLVWMGLMLAIVLGLSYGIERPLYPNELEAADHTHAFDTYCQPFLSSASPPAGGYPSEIWRRVRLETQPHEAAGAVILFLMVTLGEFLACLDRYWVIETWLNRPTEPTANPARRTWDVTIPGPILAGIGLATIIAFSIVGCYAYYPTPHETLDELSLAKTEALGAALTGHREHALHWIPVCESWNRRLQVGAYLRHWHLSDYHRMKARVFRDRLEVLEHMIENRDSDEEIRRQISLTSRAFLRLATAYREELSQ
ncbi:permease [Schlesneria paludicola]|uniref:permease n=1 Tax=Schlesneria paludicola TaxID=360056 RepID=UPI00029ACF03|nr:permease [Schlesneria paludicola]